MRRKQRAIQLPKLFGRLVSPDLNAACGYKKQSLDALRKRIVTLEDPNAGGPNAHRTPYDLLAGACIADGQYHSFFGEADKAVEQWEIAYQMGTAGGSSLRPLRGEAAGNRLSAEGADGERDVYRHPGDRCIFPIDPKFKFSKLEDSAKAIQFLTGSSQAKPDDLEVRWLLNLAHMMSGTYPGGVPKEALIPPSAFASTEDLGRFKDVAPQTGINLFSEAGGLIVDDFENNGLFDIVTSDWDLLRADALCFHNNGDGIVQSIALDKSKLGSQCGRPEHDSGRLQQRWLYRHPGAARRVGDGAAEIAIAQ